MVRLMIDPKPVTKKKSIEVVVGWRGKCERCGKKMEAKRKDAKTCSDACRMAMMRDAKREDG